MRDGTSEDEQTDQAWFWNPEWQSGEQAADGQIATGRTEEFESAKSMFDALDR